MDDAPLWTPVYISPMARKALGMLANEAEGILFEAWVEGKVGKPILSAYEESIQHHTIQTRIILSIPGAVFSLAITLGKGENDEKQEQLIETLRTIAEIGTDSLSEANIVPLGRLLKIRLWWPKSFESHYKHRRHKNAGYPKNRKGQGGAYGGDRSLEEDSP